MLYYVITNKEETMYYNNTIRPYMSEKYPVLFGSYSEANNNLKSIIKEIKDEYDLKITPVKLVIQSGISNV